MPKEEPNTTAGAAVADPEAVTLQEFCTRLSSTDRRVELIAGFHHSELVAGRVKDASASYSTRYAEFVNKPVK